MKRVNLFINLSILLVLATLLVSCSGKQGSAKLEVTQSFSIGPESFSGGLIIHGINTAKQKEFSIALEPGSGNSRSVDLEYGTWDIKAVGWNDGGKFESKVLCGKASVNFSSNNQNFSLLVTNDMCHDEAFSGSSFHTTVAPNKSFAPLGVFTCGAIYKVDSNPNRLLTKEELSEEYCESYPDDFKKKSKRFTVSFPTIIEGNRSSSVSSECLTPEVATSKIIPTRFPVEVTLYDSTDCSNLSTTHKYFFKNGLEQVDLSRNQAGFDSIVKFSNDVAPTTMLAVLNNISKRGTTPFGTEIPGIGCGATHDVCTTAPPLMAAQYYLDAFQRQNIKLSGIILNCDDFDFEGLGFLNLDGDNGNCQVRNGDSYLTIFADADPGLFSFTLKDINGETLTFTAKVNANHEVQTYQTIKQIIGLNFSDENLKKSFSRNQGRDEEFSSYGDLGHVREMLSSWAVGGIFYDQTCSPSPMSAGITRSLTIYDEGELRTYSLTLNNSSFMIPKSFSNPVLSRENQGQMASRRVTLKEWRGAPQGFVTRQVIDFACDGFEVFSDITNTRMGKSEAFRDDGQRIEKELYFWNTSRSEFSRLEVYRIDEEKDSNGQLVRRQNSFHKAEKESYTDYKIKSLEYSYYNDVSGKKEYLNHFEIDKANASTVTKQSLANLHKNVLAPGEIFSDNVYREIKEKHYLGNVAPELTPVLKHSNNGKFVTTTLTPTGLVGDFFNGINYITSLPTAANPFLVDAHISNNGMHAIVASNDLANDKIYYRLLSNGVWGPNRSLTVSLNMLKVAIDDSGAFIISGIRNDGKFVYGRAFFGENLPALNRYLNIHNSVNDIIRDFKMLVENFKFYVVLRGDNFSTNMSYVTYCEATPTQCSETTLFAITNENIENLDATFSNGIYYVSFRTANLDDYETNTNTLLNLPPPTPSPVQNYGNINPSEHSLNLSMLDDNAVAPAYVNLPYTPPAAPQMRPNFMSLRPDNFNGIFTPTPTFLATP